MGELWRGRPIVSFQPFSHLPACPLTILCRIGESAKNAFHSNPRNTIFDAKRLIGRKLSDPEVQKDMKHWPFKVTERNGKPVVNVQYQGEAKSFVSPARITSR